MSWRRRDDGIVVRGAKAHQTGAINSHWILVMPTMTHGAGRRRLCGVASRPRRTPRASSTSTAASPATPASSKAASIDVGNKQFGGHEALMVFDNVFVPWENVFMCGEYEFTGMLVERFAGYHRQSYGGCKVGVGDVLIGAAALAADYNGAAKASHVKDKLIEMTHLNETLYACGISCSCEGRKTASGDLPDRSAAGQRLQAERHPLPLRDRPAGRGHRRRPDGDHAVGEGFATSGDRQGGRRSTSRAVASVPTEHRMRILRLIENITLGTAAVGYRTESMHGAGSPQAQRIMISRQGNLEQKKDLAKAIAGIPK